MLYAIVAVIALILDQAVKYWTTVNIAVNTGEKALIPGFIRLAHVQNTGAAFSFLEGARWFFVIVCLIFVVVIVYALVKNIISTPIARWMTVLVLAGAVGNCIDRVISGYVVDMFEFVFFRFPVFNVADIYITVGCIAFCLCVLLEKEQPKSAGAGEAPVAEKKRKAPVAPKLRRQKTPIPSFPKHEPIVEPKVDPNDPFAEWERRANAVSQPKVESEPIAEMPLITEQESAARPLSQTPKAAPVAPVAPVAPAAEAPKAKSEADSFNLDDILAEFRDL